MNAHPRRGTALLLAATTCWGAASAALANMDILHAGGAPFVAAGGAVLLCAIAIVRHGNLLQTFNERPAHYVQLGFLGALNLGMYIAALQLGPLPIVVALHLTAPVLLIGYEVKNGQRGFTATHVLELALLLGATLLVALSVAPGAEGSSVLLGSALALGSAVSVAMLITTVVNSAQEQEPDVSAGLQLCVTAVFTLPLAFIAPPSSSDILWLLLIGIALLGPGFALYWRALRVIDAPLAGILGLNEAIIALIFGALIFSAPIRFATAGAAVLILSATALELRGGGYKSQRAVAGP